MKILPWLLLVPAIICFLAAAAAANEASQLPFLTLMLANLDIVGLAASGVGFIGGRIINRKNTWVSAWNIVTLLLFLVCVISTSMRPNNLENNAATICSVWGGIMLVLALLANIRAKRNHVNQSTPRSNS